MGVSGHDETELKLDAGPGAILPSLAEVDGVSAVRQPVEMTLDAVYFDTARLDLARHGITLRRRTGGDDAGWHLKLPAGEDTRSEVRLPLGTAPKTVPARLLAPVRAVVRDRPLAPIAEVRTRRLQYDIVDAAAVVLAQVCDDEVHAERLRVPTGLEAWREWEIELVNGTRRLLDAIEARLLEAGASPPTTASKLLRALGDQLPPPRERPSREELSRGTVAQLVLAHLAAQTDELHAQDMRLRNDEPGSVHKLRIAARRLRSAVKTYRRLFTAESADTADIVGVELRWLGQVLSKARDAQVMRERLDLLVASEPAELVLGPVSQRIDDDLSTQYRAGLEQALEAVNSERYFRLLDALDELVHSPSLTRKSDGPAKEVLPRLLRRDAKRLRRAVDAIARADDRHQRDLTLHEARKKAKRVRYAAESAIPVFPGKAKKLATSAKRVQRALGEHQDSVVARIKLREYGAQTHLSGENGFTFGRLHGLEQARAENAEREFEAAWRRTTQKQLARWIGRT